MKRNPALTFVLTAICLGVVGLSCPVIKAQKGAGQPPQQKMAELYVPTGHTATVAAAVFSPDGKTLASGSRDKTIRLWNVEAGQEIRPLAGHSGWVWSVAFSLDGKSVVSGSYDKTIKIWDAETGRLIKSPDRTDPDTIGEVFKVVPDFTFLKEKETITTDGRFQIKSGDNGRLDLYQLKTGRHLASLITFGEAD
jgi:WD40 repeat protein